jgi:hypothetical protein
MRGPIPGEKKRAESGNNQASALSLANSLFPNPDEYFMITRTFSFLKTTLFGVATLLGGTSIGLHAQIKERPRPPEWKQLVPGARFMDRFLPMPEGKLSSDTWGASGVVPRYVDNGIEDRQTSYWGGNIMRDAAGKYHFYVCGWPENSPKGHWDWPDAVVFHATGDNSIGPFKVVETIGKGWNPEAFLSRDGKHVIYFHTRQPGYYISDSLNGPWKAGKFEFNSRDRRIIEGLTNLTFAQREDGSYLMVCRGGGVWFSKTGLTPYNQVSDKRVYPAVAGAFEDPVIWRDHVQYHLIVNDWLGRIAWYQRSKDGVNWVTDPGEAYMPGVAKHANGHVEDWFKFERIKVLQDKYGRAIQANLAVIDILKHEDKANDNHSSKNISIPLNPGLLLTILDKAPITTATKTIRVRIAAEEGFNPHADVDVNSLRFGASTEVNFGRGSKVQNTEEDGTDLIVTFNAEGNGIKEDEFAPKLIGKTKKGGLLYGYARLPYVNYIEPILSSLKPKFDKKNGAWEIEVQNFGQVASQPALLQLKDADGKELAKEKVPALKPFEKTLIRLQQLAGVKNVNNGAVVIQDSNGKILSNFTFKTTPPPVAKKTPAAPVAKKSEAYLFSYFTGNGVDGLHLAWSEDGLNWKALNNGKSYLRPAVGKGKLMRDPSIARDDNGLFHMVWTTGWHDNGIGYASSKDLIHWSEQKNIPVMGKFDGVKNTWAPEIFYDKKTKTFQIFWASTVPGMFAEVETSASEKGSNHRMFYITTKDFKTFSETKVFLDPGFSVIDGAILEKAGKYYLFLKNENSKPAEKNIRVTVSDNPVSFSNPISAPISGKDWAEGPSPLQVGEYTYVYFDKYTRQRYGVIRSKDLVNWEDISEQLTYPKNIRHGTAFPVEKEFIEKLIKRK